jgi:membrane associated rhomboid family serine protease
MLIVGDDNETRNFPFVNWLLILGCIAVFIWQVIGVNDLGLVQYGLVPRRFLDHLALAELGTLITAMFMHGDLFHIIGNLWYLFIFGDNIEDHFGHFNYLAFYLTCGVIGGLTEIVFNPTMSAPMIGASGAIAGVLGAYLVLYPQVAVKTWWGDDSIFFLFRTFNIPAWFAIGGWFVLQYVFLMMGLPGIAWHCHIGGFAAGVLTVFLFNLAGERGQDNGFGSAAINESNAWFRVVFSLLLIGAFAATAIAYVGGAFTSKPAQAIAKPAAKPGATAKATQNQNQHAAPSVVSSHTKELGTVPAHKHWHKAKPKRRSQPKKQQSATRRHNEISRYEAVSASGSV